MRGFDITRNGSVFSVKRTCIEEVRMGTESKNVIRLQKNAKPNCWSGCARQVENGHRGPAGSDDELLQLARQLYELLVPQAIGAKGDAQQIARKFLSPLADKDAVGGLGIAKAGNKPRWVRMREAGEPGWEEEKEKAETRKSADRTADVLRALADFGLKPLMRVYTDSEMSSVEWKPLRKGQAVRTWDRDMFQQAIERMMSWESWNQRVGQEYAKLVEQKNRFEQKNFVGQEHLVHLVNQLQQDMKEASPGLESKEQTAHYVTGRALRGSDKVFEKWGNSPPMHLSICTTPKSRMCRDVTRDDSDHMTCSQNWQSQSIRPCGAKMLRFSRVTRCTTASFAN